ncbi:hypothetical protein [Sphaerimonospora mesophila]|uniref:hypothetical protein n=1 Tax=Sphaerimonospora mesophila TaxID=37483 RepID=UPI0006E217EA
MGGGHQPGAVLDAIAVGRTRFHEIGDAVGTDPTRTLDRLIELRLVERLIPVTEDERRPRRKIYRIADNFLAFYLGPLMRNRSKIEIGLGETILPVIVLRYAICGRTEVREADPGVLTVTAADIFSPD